MADTHTRSSTKWWVGGVLAVATVLLAISAWSWARALWTYPDLTEAQRTEQFNDALVARRNGAGVIARPERGGLAILARSDIAQVGTSQCVRDMACESYLRLPLRNDPGLACLHVGVTFSCAYAIKTTDGGAATAFAKFHSNRQYEIGVSAPGSAKPLEVGEPRFHMLDEPGLQEANDILCRRGAGCPAAAGAPSAQAQTVSAKAGPSAPPSAATTTGREFQDCHNGFCGPTMVVLPTGRSLRGSSPADIERLLKDDPRTSRDSLKNETPQREVTIGYELAVAKFETTFDAWDACVADGGCKHRPNDPSHPTRGTRPVVHVSWIDITDEFLPWFNRKLGLSGASAYRLLTETEWEYAARAGTTTKYAFGDIVSTSDARFYESHSVEVGSFAPNAFGLHDMHGNVPEWVQDCFDSDYGAAPVNGSAHITRHCGSRIYRGGSWNDLPIFLRSAYRGIKDPKDRSQGFRVARTLAVN